MSKLTYPVAQRDGSPVTPDEVQRGDISLRCLGCAAPMIVRQGEVKVWHFAHKQEGSCGGVGEGELHKVAKQFIKDGFCRAKKDKVPYYLWWPCEKCGFRWPDIVPMTPQVTRHGWDKAGDYAGEIKMGNIFDLTKLADHVELEEFQELSKIEGWRGFKPDVLFKGALHNEERKNLFAIEVVVTSDVSPRTTEKYKVKGLRMFRVRPTLESVEKLRTGIEASENLNVKSDPLYCPNCKEFEIAHFIVDKAMARKKTFEPWDTDSDGVTMPESTRLSVLEDAQMLADLGFTQPSNGNEPTIFILHLDAHEDKEWRKWTTPFGANYHWPFALVTPYVNLDSKIRAKGVNPTLHLEMQEMDAYLKPENAVKAIMTYVKEKIIAHKAGKKRSVKIMGYTWGEMFQESPTED